MKGRRRRRAGLMKVGRTMIVIGRKCAALSILESKSEDLSPNENNELTNKISSFDQIVVNVRQE